ncbi:MAG: hypothetical protein NZM37_11630 [Sandaracinaceae bacterium]|nr:hypothetical protein [Sandaracinaceae bacterium]MDW8247598.1 hypothetical protein [Sandaracinaceae bacterium]
MEEWQVKGFPWLRSFVLFGRAKASGRLVLRGKGRVISVKLHQGKVRGIEGMEEDALGEVVGRFLCPGEEQRGLPIGALAVERACLDRSGLAWALRKQMRRRFRRLIEIGDGLQAHWEGPGAAPRRPFEEEMPLEDLMAEGLRQLGEEILKQGQGRIPKAPPIIPKTPPIETETGRWLSRGALHPEEFSALFGCPRGPRGEGFLAAFWLGGLAEVPTPKGVKELLFLRHKMRKGRLDLRFRSNEERRNWLRNWARQLHPDRFAEDPRLAALSTSLIQELMAQP